MSSQKPKKRKSSAITKKAVKPADLLPESREFLMLKKEAAMPRPTEPAARENREMMEKEYRYKKMIMWSGITFFMILIVAAWGFNMKQVFERSAVKASDKEAGKDWSELSAELDKALSAIKEGSRELGSIGEAQDALPAETPGFDEASVNALKDKLESASSTAAETEEDAVAAPAVPEN